AATVPRLHELGDLVQAAPQLLGSGDEPQPLQRRLVVEPIAGPGARRGGEEADVLVVPQRRRREPRALGHLGDLERAHDRTLSLRVDMKIKCESADVPAFAGPWGVRRHMSRPLCAGWRRAHPSPSSAPPRGTASGSGCATASTSSTWTPEATATR